MVYRYGSATTRASGTCSNACSASATRTSTGQLDLLVRRVAADEHLEAVELELLDPAARELEVPVVRRVERAAEEADHSNTRVSSPTSTSTPLRAPAARSACSSSSGAGGVPVTRNPRSVRRIR